MRISIVWRTAIADIAQMRRDLRDAADVSGGHDLGAGSTNRVGLPPSELGGHLRLFEVVEPRGSAAHLAVFQLDDGRVWRWRTADAAALRARLARDRGDTHRDTRSSSVARARAACAGRGDRGTPRRRPPACAYVSSFIADPQPAAVVTIASMSAWKRAGVSAASSSACASSPTCRASAPQQPWSRGTTTSTPLAASTRTAAALIDGRSTRWTHPASSATRARRGPIARVSGRSAAGAGAWTAGDRSSGGATAESAGASRRARRPARSARRNRAGDSRIDRSSRRDCVRERRRAVSSARARNGTTSSR